MQVSATLIAAQQAAREARVRLAMPQVPAAPQFAASLEKAQGFAPLPLKQTAPTAPAAQAAPASAPTRMGQHVDITV